MAVLLWFGVVVSALGIAYVTQFAGATLTFGRTLSDSDSGTGFQDAITPPWQTNLALLAYGLALSVVGISWYQFGWGRGLLSIVLIFVGSLVIRRTLPGIQSAHFQRLIVRSMSRRYANFVRDGDSVRAELMKMLLRKAGVDAELLK